MAGVIAGRDRWAIMGELGERWLRCLKTKAVMVPVVEKKYRKIATAGWNGVYVKESISTRSLSIGFAVSGNLTIRDNMSRFPTFRGSN
jgi:hypothetical protein